MCPNNHKFTEEKLRELGAPELFITESRKMHDGFCTTRDYDAFIQEILDCWEYSKKVFKGKKNETPPKVDG
jgi:hypothetical protein